MNHETRANWARNYQYRAGHLLQPRTVGEIQEIVRGAKKVKALGTRHCYLHLLELVNEGALNESELDELIAPMLFWKFQMGLFEDPYVDPDMTERIVGREENGKLALQAAREAITLLKNENDLLPLDLNNIRKIAVIGPNANRNLLGGYSGHPKYNVTVLQGIKARVGDSAEVLHSKGCKITLGGSWNQDEVIPSDVSEDLRQIAEAVQTAEQAEAVMLVRRVAAQVESNATPLRRIRAVGKRGRLRSSLHQLRLNRCIA